MSGPSQAGDGQHRAGQAEARKRIGSGLAAFGLTASEAELAVIAAVVSIYGPVLDALMAAGFDDVPHEPGADMSRPPRAHEER